MSLSKKSKYHKKIGQIPGTITYTGEKSNPLVIEVFDYTSDSLNEFSPKTIEDTFQYKFSNSVTWINIDGLNNTKDIEKIGRHFDIHPLNLEDIVNVGQRTKIDDYPEYLFLVLKMLYYNKTNEIVSEQVSFTMGNNYVLTFQESEGDVFGPIRDRLRNTKGRIRTLGVDYLLYALIDAITDHYYAIIEIMGNKVETLEDHLFDGQNNHEISKQIQELKRELLKVRRSIFPLRDILNRLEKIDNTLVQDKTLRYFRDVYDHVIQISESIEIYREMIWGLMDMYMTSINNKMNEVMKVLTIIATIFIPLTFIAGIYGMNFENMPELKFKYGYFLVWVVMIVLFAFMLLYFKRKKWL